MALGGMTKRMMLACTSAGREKDDLMRRSTNCQRCSCALLEVKPDRDSEYVAFTAALTQPPPTAGASAPSSWPASQPWSQ